MKKYLYFFFISLIFSCSSDETKNEPVQEFCGIYQGNAFLRTQIEVEEFASCNYTEVTGNLHIYDGNVQWPITDLSSLKSLKKIGGGLGIALNGLSSLYGLHNIESCNIFTLNSTSMIENLDELDGLQANYIEIYSNSGLLNIDGLDMDSDTLITIDIYNNPLLTNINCFSNIKTLTSALVIKYNPSLTNLSGLNNLEAINSISISCCSSSLDISNNENLQSINELNNLTFVRGGITINQNRHLANIDGLSNVSVIEGDVNIGNNFLLYDINGFQNLVNLDGDLRIHENPYLTIFCGLQNLFINDGLTGSYEIFGNLNNPNHTSILNAPSCN